MLTDVLYSQSSHEAPEYVFLQSTPQLYEYIEEDYPEIFAEIKRTSRPAGGSNRWDVGRSRLQCPFW